MSRISLLPAALLCLLPACLHAADLVVSFGQSDFVLKGAEDDKIYGAEVHLDPFARWRGAEFSFAAAADVHDTGTFWVGAGVSAVRPFGNGWFVEASLMPGYFEPKQVQQDLGSALEFRSLLGVGRRISNQASISLAVSHKSNAGTAANNPGVNLIRLRLRYSLD
jgi:lipid A 3-O-deacylase